MALIRSSPKPSFGHGESDATYSVAEDIELPLIARELLPLRLDDVRGRVLHEALVREHAFGAGDLFAQPVDLGRSVAVPAALLLRPHDRFEDAWLPPFERQADAAAAEHLGCLLHACECAGLRVVSRLRP